MTTIHNRIISDHYMCNCLAVGYRDYICDIINKIENMKRCVRFWIQLDQKCLFILLDCLYESIKVIDIRHQEPFIRNSDRRGQVKKVDAYIVVQSECLMMNDLYKIINDEYHFVFQTHSSPIWCIMNLKSMIG